MSEMKKVDQYAQAISSIPAIVDHYIDNKQREAIQQAIKSHTAECKEEALADRREYIDLIDTSRNITESLEDAVLAKPSSQPKSTYEAAASLSEFELTKILMDKMEDHKSYLRADYKRELYDALVKSYNTDNYLFDTYGMIRRKSSKDVESSRDPKSKESKSTSSSKGISRSQHKLSGKSAHVEDPSHTIGDSGVQQNQEFDTGNNDEQPDDEAVSMYDWYKKTEQPLTPDPDWNKRQHVDLRPSQTCISIIAYAEKPPTSFDELMDTLIDFSTFVMNRLNITNLTQELLVGPAFNLLKGTCKSRTKLEYHFEECFKATTKRLDWHNPKGKQYLFDLFTSLNIMKWYDYGHLDEIEVRREDQQLYTFKEAALLKKVNAESGEVHWWKRIWRRPQTTYMDNMTPSYLVLLHFSQNWRDLPRNIPLVSVEVHSRHGPSDAMHNPPQPLKVIPIVTAITSRQVKIQCHMLILNRQNIKIKEFQRSFCHSDTEHLSRSDEVLLLKNFKKDVVFKLSRPRNNNSMSMSVQMSQVHKMATRLQNDDKRLCLVDDLKEVQVHIQVKPIRTSSSLKSTITMPYSQDEVKKTNL
ncbi:hypothetical protein Tco_0078288 [Tanacetum coccineum]